MAATIGANGLSVVHKGSEGEANASVPDVCLTKVGKPVVPIPYGNNAKSSDLANGSTTVTADGGNSIALQGSTFSTSTGDASGDKKGVSSGTIEGEAKFVTASSNVIIEGRGVARQTDQMTMNNANTMCFGVQNPSVTVEEAAEPTFGLDVSIRYPNGKRLTNANYALTDDSGATVGSGSLDAKGQSEAVGLKPGKVKIKAEESTDNYQISSVRRENPHYVESISDDEFFDIASKGQQTFWLPARVETLGTPWGSIGQSLASDVYFQDIVEAEIKRHFTHFHPETAYEFGKTCEAVIGSIDMPMPHTTETLLAYSMPLALEEGEMLSTLLRLAPHETTDRMLAYMRARGEGNPQTYLANYDWDNAQKNMNETLDTLLEKIKTRLIFLRDEASKLKYAYLSEEVFDKHIDTVSTYAKGLPDLISGAFNKMRNKAAALLADTSNVKVIKAADDTHSTEGDGIEAVVNTTKTIDTVEPFMNEVPGVIDNVIPIYPVRYGYANFFDELMPAQAPPSMTEMSSATGLKDTGGYLLRLLREGWLYIKEENEEEDSPLHIFKYAQTETATGVIEKFEKYYFTNEENAQGGLTLDTSSGSTFYPFAFVTPKAKKISIVYSEHEWAAEIIDNMNGDQEWRGKAMQQVDLSSPQTEFSQEATQENLSALVEDYRRSDEKWLANQNNSQANPMGLDVFTTENNHYLSPLGIVETMQKSHSEKKEGTLVALFDPVGRQADIALSLSMLFIAEKAFEAGRVYPKTIGDIILQLQKSGSGVVKESINENVDLTELNNFYQDNSVVKEQAKARRKEILELYSAFAYKALSDNSLGSLNAYFDLYFYSQSPKNKVKEIEKLSRVMQATLDGIEGTEEGQKVVFYMVSDEAAEDSAYVTYQRHLEAILLQCQDDVDWSDVTKALTKNTANILEFVYCWISSSSKYVQKGTITSALILRPLAFTKLLNFIPIFFEKGFGIKEIDGHVRITLDKLAEVLAKNIDSIGKHDSPLNRAITAHHAGKKMINWANSQWKNRMPEFESSAKGAKWPELEIPRFGGRFSNFTAESSLELLGKGGDGAISMVSLRANIDVLIQLIQSSAFEKADPLRRGTETDTMLDYAKIVTALSAGITDFVSVSRAKLLLQKRLLNSNGVHYALRSGLPQLLSTKAIGARNVITAKIDSLIGSLESISNGSTISKLVIISNLAVMASSGYGAYDAYQTGNRALFNGHIYTILGSTFFLAGPVMTLRNMATIRYGNAYFFLFGMIFLLAADAAKKIGFKSDFDNLLYRGFWGKGDKYSFWYFEDGGEFTIPKRLAVAAKHYQSDKYQLALQIEQQEFLNYFYQPRMLVEVSEISTTKKCYTYEFRLPNFKLGESNIIAAVYNTRVINIGQTYPAKNSTQVEASLNPEATEAFRKALSEAETDIERFPQYALSELCQNFNIYFSVIMESEPGETLEVRWYYEQSPGITVPKRMVTREGHLVKTYHGMIDGNYSNI
ncbi:hypothetical protein GCM10007906_42550 [Vibrio hyugaensis]|uniref:Toxin VasX N-terminal region domain-containing protein n=1 Tax=Vibrio hyugaensis TaxID=1534743 RepID=A0ABQ5Y6R8_9VIBR|nr:PAAR-like domain-containing protein [Vibrio hyugaensis]GLR06667.1 hypothetical protein GCM10007906_42550 [Vibrio hyugaensis]